MNLRTVESLPRTPTEAGIIPINLKRRLKYKQTHKTQYVSVEKIIKALTTLKSLGNQYYQFVPDFEEFKKCKNTDRWVQLTLLKRSRININEDTSKEDEQVLLVFFQIYI